MFDCNFTKATRRLSWAGNIKALLPRRIIVNIRAYSSFIPIMADPFEVRMRFTSQLQHLNASVNSSQKAAHYALKYKDMDEDLHSCILEQLERVCSLSPT